MTNFAHCEKAKVQARDDDEHDDGDDEIAGPQGQDLADPEGGRIEEQAEGPQGQHPGGREQGGTELQLGEHPLALGLGEVDLALDETGDVVGDAGDELTESGLARTRRVRGGRINRGLGLRHEFGLS